METVNLLLKWGVDKDVTNRDGQSPLHIAAQEGDVDIVDTLLAAGAAGILDKDGKTAKDLAEGGGWGEVVALFEEYGRQH